ncbi:Ubiquinone/menaquinone biosynthesis C-methylase UbiE [Thermomonospora echinospora]|uniref:Ubiquinone/menaquinone biosynthesis C-methylase UbiE n=1 Tax=Thermomonospora echinospora TaxID=1992 RepID=A0A1H5VC99_9ACTN|nr:methyltransferase domain-containing protein [Thermomonospora echinospora]SEF84860.1 Ubiquinone/menaquinone biosynthesis C-methylase UbiE [Thermomonospora echinospora]
MTVTREGKITQGIGGRPGRGGDQRLITAFGAELARLVEFIEPELDLEDVVLEVCSGTGRVSRAIARRVRHVTALDRSPEAIREGKREADQDALMNVTFARGDATDLPYADRSFTLLLTRSALHRVEDPAAVLRELVRVSRPGAGLVVADVVRPEGVDGDPDEPAKLRDPAHRELLTAERIAELIGEAGADVRRRDLFDVVRPVDAWLAEVGTPAEAAGEIRARLKAELDGGPATGLRPVLAEDELCVTLATAYLGATAP